MGRLASLIAASFGIVFMSFLGAQVGCGLFDAPTLGKVIGGLVGMIGLAGMVCCQQGFRQSPQKPEEVCTRRFLEQFQDLFGGRQLLLPIAGSYLIRQVDDGRVMVAVRDATGMLKILRMNRDVLHLIPTDEHYSSPLAEFHWRPPVSVAATQPTDDYQWGIDNGMLIGVVVVGRQQDLRLGT